MPMRRIVRIVIIAVLPIVVLVALPIPSTYTYASGDLVAPIIAGDVFGAPSNWMTSLLACAGGLPSKPGSYVLTGETKSPDTICFAKSAEPIELWQVARWELTRVSVNGYWGPLLEFIPVPFVNIGGNLHAPRYSIAAEYRIRYLDGTNRRARWETWRWGVTLGPVAIDTGHGPAGDITLLDQEPHQQ